MNKTLYSDMQYALKRFTLEELNKDAIDQIQDINWDDVLKQLIKNKQQYTKSEVINLIVEEIKKLELEDDVLIEIIENLKLLYMAISKSKTWLTYKLINQNTRVPLSIVELNSKIERKFRQIGQKFETHGIDHNGKFIISIKIFNKRGKKSAAEFKAVPPLFVVFHPNTNYIFISRMIGTEKINLALARTLGYQGLKPVKLTGKDTNELIKILLHKDDNLERIDYNEPEFVPKIKTTDSVIDCTTSKEKMEYADQVFNENLSLQTLTLNIHNVKCISKELKGEKMSASLKITAPNIKEAIKNLIVIRAIDTPIPEYLRDIFKKGKNIFEIGKP